MTNGASRSITAKAAANIWSAERASIDNVNVEKGSGSKGLELPNSGELAVCIYFARRRSDRMRERSLRVSAQPYPNRYPRCRSAVMTRFTIIAIVALITTTAHAQGLVPYYGPDGQVYYRRAPEYAPAGVPADI